MYTIKDPPVWFNKACECPHCWCLRHMDVAEGSPLSGCPCGCKVKHVNPPAASHKEVRTMKLIENIKGCAVKPAPITRWGELKVGECAEHTDGSVLMRVGVGCHNERLGTLRDNENSASEGRKLAVVCLTGVEAGKGYTFDCGSSAFKKPLPNVGLVKDTEA